MLHQHVKCVKGRDIHFDTLVNLANLVLAGGKREKSLSEEQSANVGSFAGHIFLFNMGILGWITE